MMDRPGSQRRVELPESLDDPLLALRHYPHALADGDCHEDQYRDDDDREFHASPGCSQLLICLAIDWPLGR